MRVVPAKITRPRIDNPVLRPRLFDLLDARLDAPVREPLDPRRDVRIVWVMGPPGSGKTTLVSSYLSDRGPHSLWYQLDADDADIATFFHDFGLAIQQASRPDAAPLPRLMPELLPGLPTFTRRYAETVAARLPQPMVIVLDNYENLPDGAPLHGVVRDLATALPSGMRVIVSSRVPPPPEYARLQVNQDLDVIDGDALELTRDEALALVAARRGEPATADQSMQVDRLLAETRGWFAGFSLLLARSGDSAPPEQDLKARQLLFDYFATEAFERFAPDVQHALLRTALLPTMTAQEAEAMSGHAAIGAALTDLHRQNLFVTERGRSPPVYEFHALFRSFLLDRAVVRIGEGDWRALQVRAADLLAAAGSADAAATLYRAARHWRGVEELALKEAASLVSSGRHRTLDRWLSDLPEVVLTGSPWLSFWQATARLPFDAVTARALFEAAYRGFEERDDGVGLYSAWAGLMETFFFEWRDFRDADRWIVEFEGLRMRHPAFPSAAVELRTYWAMGTLLHRQPQHPMLPDWSRRGVALLDGGNRDLSLLLGGYLTIWFLWRGETLEASRILERIAPWATPDVSPLVRILWICANALYRSVRGELDRCQAAEQEGLEVATRNGLHAFDFLLAAQTARCGLIAGRLLDADAALARMAACMRTRSHSDGAFHAQLLSHAAGQRGDRQMALDHARSAMAMALEAGVPFLEANCRICLAHALLGRDDDREWIEQVAAARAIGQAMESRVIEYLCLETEASVALLSGRRVHGLECLRKALALSDLMDGATWLMAGPHATTRLYEVALDAGIETVHVRRLIRRRRLVPVDPATACDAWPWPVRVHTLGRFEIVCDDEPLRSSGKTQRKPLELLKCLCAFGGRAVHQDRITDALWPDTHGDAADQALRTTLHRLRKLLGNEQAVRLEDRQLHLETGTVWVDCLAFERAAREPDAGDGVASRRALDLYRGGFLDGESAAWAIDCRDRMRAHFLGSTERLGLMRETVDDWAGAADCYLRAIELEPLAERFYRRLMHSYGRMGRRADALVVYQRCRHALLSRLGISPALETQAMERRLAAS